MLSFRGKDLGFSEHITFLKEHHVNVGWKCVNCFANLGYTLYTYTRTHAPTRAHQKRPIHRLWPLPYFTGTWVQ